jgi:hypothetical protein
MCRTIEISVEVIKSCVHKTGSLSKPYDQNDEQKIPLIFALGSNFIHQIKIILRQGLRMILERMLLFIIFWDLHLSEFNLISEPKKYKNTKFKKLGYDIKITN